MLKAGVFGAGHLGKIHLKLLKESSKYELVGFYDDNQETAAAIEKEFCYKSFNSAEFWVRELEMCFAKSNLSLSGYFLKFSIT